MNRVVKHAKTKEELKRETINEFYGSVLDIIEVLSDSYEIPVETLVSYGYEALDLIAEEISLVSIDDANRNISLLVISKILNEICKIKGLNTVDDLKAYTVAKKISETEDITIEDCLTRYYGYSIEEVKRVLAGVKLATPVNIEKANLVDEYSLEDYIDKVEIKRLLSEAMSTHLSVIEQYVISESFGFNGGICKSIEMIASETNTSEKYIRDLKTTALKKLRHPSVIDRLKEYSTHSIAK